MSKRPAVPFAPAGKRRRLESSTNATLADADPLSGDVSIVEDGVGPALTVSRISGTGTSAVTKVGTNVVITSASTDVTMDDADPLSGNVSIVEDGVGPGLTVSRISGTGTSAVTKVGTNVVITSASTDVTLSDTIPLGNGDSAIVDGLGPAMTLKKIYAAPGSGITIVDNGDNLEMSMDGIGPYTTSNAVFDVFPDAVTLAAYAVPITSSTQFTSIGYLDIFPRLSQSLVSGLDWSNSTMSSTIGGVFPRLPSDKWMQYQGAATKTFDIIASIGGSGAGSFVDTAFQAIMIQVNSLENAVVGNITGPYSHDGHPAVLVGRMTLAQGDKIGICLKSAGVPTDQIIYIYGASILITEIDFINTSGSGGGGIASVSATSPITLDLTIPTAPVIGFSPAVEGAVLGAVNNVRAIAPLAVDYVAGTIEFTSTAVQSVTAGANVTLGGTAQNPIINSTAGGAGGTGVSGGWANYSDTLYTVGAPLSIAAGVRTQITCNGLGAGTNTSNGNGVANIWLASAMEGVADYSYVFRLQLTADPTGPGTGEYMDIEFDIAPIGGPPNVITHKILAFPKGGLFEEQSITSSLFAGATFEANAMRVFMEPSIGVNVYDISVFIENVYNPSAGVGTVDSITAGTGISVTGTPNVPIVTNTAPDQIVTLSSTTLTTGGAYPVKTVEMPATGVTAASYTSTNLTVDAYGRITAASSGSAASTLSLGTFPTGSATTSPANTNYLPACNKEFESVIPNTSASSITARWGLSMVAPIGANPSNQCSGGIVAYSNSITSVTASSGSVTVEYGYFDNNNGAAFVTSGISQVLGFALFSTSLYRVSLTGASYSLPANAFAAVKLTNNLNTGSIKPTFFVTYS